jgi:hypothetical protein
MTREQTIEAIRVMQAYVDGKEVQVRSRKWNPRESLKPDWVDEELSCWNFEDFDYRIKPTAKLRPWTADEVPLGAWIRFKKVIDDRSILAWTSTQRDRDMWLDEREHSTDGGKNWLPCGVVEEAK